jgi:hypothetical protein
MTSYVVYQIADSRYAGRKGRYGDPIFDSLGAAKSHMTRLIRDGKFTADQIAVAELGMFREYIEQIVERRHLMTGEPIFERINVPGYLSASSEAYWSM